MLAAAAVVCMALLIAAPLLPLPLSVPLYGLGGIICHQLADRSFHVAGSQLPVCARCLGVYAGAALTLIVLPVGRTFMVRQASHEGSPYLGVAILPLAMLPTVVTVTLEQAGLWHTSNVARAIAGAPLGAAAAMLLAGAAAKLHYERCTPTRPGESSPPPTPI